MLFEMVGVFNWMDKALQTCYAPIIMQLFHTAMRKGLTKIASLRSTLHGWIEKTPGAEETEFKSYQQDMFSKVGTLLEGVDVVYL